MPICFGCIYHAERSLSNYSDSFCTIKMKSDLISSIFYLNEKVPFDIIKKLILIILFTNLYVYIEC